MPIVFIGPTPLNEKEAWGLVSRGYDLSTILPKGIGNIRPEELNMITHMVDNKQDILSYDDYIRYRDVLSFEQLKKHMDPELFELYPKIDHEGLKLYKIFAVGPDSRTQDKIIILGNYKTASNQLKFLINKLYPEGKSDQAIGLMLANDDEKSSRYNVCDILLNYELAIDSPQISRLTATALGIDLRAFSTDTVSNSQLTAKDTDEAALLFIILDKYFDLPIQSELLDVMMLSQEDYKTMVTDLVVDDDLFDYTNRTDLSVAIYKGVDVGSPKPKVFLGAIKPSSAAATVTK